MESVKKTGYLYLQTTGKIQTTEGGTSGEIIGKQLEIEASHGELFQKLGEKTEAGLIPASEKCQPRMTRWGE